MYTIVPALEEVLHEAFDSASSLLPPPLRSSFVLVGGAALVRWGCRRKTVDVDVAASSDALLAFFPAAQSDARFCVSPDRRVFSFYT